ALDIGQGVRIAYDRGSRSHDEIAYDSVKRQFYHLSNRAGGIEGGITNGEEVRVVGYLKPIPTLKKALRSVDMISKEPFLAQHERSDTCTVPAAGVIGETMVALVLAEAFLDLEEQPGIGIRRSLRPSALPVEAFDYLAPRQRIAYSFETKHGVPEPQRAGG